MICFGSPSKRIHLGPSRPGCSLVQIRIPLRSPGLLSCPHLTPQVGLPTGNPSSPLLGRCLSSYSSVAPSRMLPRAGRHVGGGPERQCLDMRGPRWPHQPHGPQWRLQESRSRTLSWLSELTVNTGAVTSTPQLTGRPCKGRALLDFQDLASLLECRSCSKPYDE